MPGALGYFFILLAKTLRNCSRAAVLACSLHSTTPPLRLNQSCHFHLNIDRKEICAGSRPTDSLPLFLWCPRTGCHSDVQSSSPLLRSAVEAFCSVLIHALPRYFHISEWTLCTELEFLGRKRKERRRWRRRRRRKSHIWLFCQADCNQTSNESQLLGEGMNQANSALMLFNHYLKWNQQDVTIKPTMTESGALTPKYSYKWVYWYGQW